MSLISSPCVDLQRAEHPRHGRRRPKSWSPEGLERLRAAALATRPWKLTRGPKTADGKARSARNGRVRQKGEKSVRELRAELVEVFSLINQMAAARRSVMRFEAGSDQPADVRQGRVPRDRTVLVDTVNGTESRDAAAASAPLRLLIPSRRGLLPMDSDGDWAGSGLVPIRSRWAIRVRTGRKPQEDSFDEF